MKTYNGVDFLINLKKFGKCTLDLSSYLNHPYECVCGKTHILKNPSSIICQGAWKLVLECPDNNENITCVKLKSKFLGIGFAGFESLYGAKLSKTSSTPEESLLIFHYTVKKIIG